MKQIIDISMSNLGQWGKILRSSVYKMIYVYK